MVNRDGLVSACAVLALALARPASPDEAAGTNGRAAATPLEVEQAFEDLKSPDWILKWSAMSRLARWGVRDAAPQLRAVLGGRDHPWVRGRALVALAELLGEEVLAEAQARSADPAAPLRAAAVEALGILASPKGEGALAERLGDPAPEVRCQAIVALARVRREGAWETLAPLLENKEPALVQHAARALAFMMGRPEAPERAIALLGHSDPAVRAEAANTIAQARLAQAIPVLLRRMAADGEPKVRLAAERALAGFSGNTLFLPLLAALRGVEPQLYASALRVLALRPVAEAAEGVAALLREPGHPYREVLPEAFLLLSRVDADRYVGVFAAHLGHPTAYVRVKAIESIAKCAGADQLRLLRPALLDKDQGVRVAAFRAVRNIADATPPEGIVEYLADALRQGEKWTQRAALDLLCERVTPADLARVVAIVTPILAGKDKADREYVAKALARLGDEATRRRIAAAQGYVTAWNLIGPFPYDSRNRGYGPACFPEHEIDFAKAYPPAAWDPTAVFRTGEATCGGQRRKAIAMQPPTSQGPPRKLIASFTLELPEADDLKLTLALGLEDGAADGDGVAIELAADGRKLLERKLLKPEGWLPAEASLADFAGKRTTLELSLDPLGGPKDDKAAIAEPIITGGGQSLASLIELADSAPVRIAHPEPKPPLAWMKYQVPRIDGEVSLYDIYPLPLDGKLVYGVADLSAPEARKAIAHVKSDDGFILWLNGVKVKERPGAGEERVEVALRQGPNRFLIKVFNLHEWWLYSLRLTDPDGRAIEFAQDNP